MADAALTAAPSSEAIIAAAERGADPLVRADPRRRIRVIWNATAGHKAGLPTSRVDEDELRRLMRKYGLGDDLCPTHTEAEAIAAIREARERGVDTLAAAGGDGTFGLVARQVVGSTLALGVVPLGSVMNVARQLGIPRNAEAGVAIVALGRTRRIDVGEVRSELFFESAAVGFSAAIFSQLGKVDRGDWLALPKAVRQAFRYRPSRVTVQMDRETVSTRALAVTIAIGPYSGPGMTVAPSAEMSDGQFDITVWRHFSKLDLIRHFMSIAFGRRAYAAHTRTYRSRQVRVTGDRPLLVRADGTDVGVTPVDFRVRPQALTVLVPGDCDGTAKSDLQPSPSSDADSAAPNPSASRRARA